MKKKNLIVALISSLIISSVLVLTLVGYVIYIELKAEEFKNSYHGLLQRSNAKSYSKYLEITKLDAKVEGEGALKGRPIIEGVIANRGQRSVSDLLLKVKFIDRDGAIIYEAAFHPQEPSLGIAGLSSIPIPYLSSQTTAPLKMGDALHFKKILTDCPDEVLAELQPRRGFAKKSGRWSGEFASEVLSIDF